MTIQYRSWLLKRRIQLTVWRYTVHQVNGYNFIIVLCIPLLTLHCAAVEVSMKRWVIILGTLLPRCYNYNTVYRHSVKQTCCIAVAESMVNHVVIPSGDWCAYSCGYHSSTMYLTYSEWWGDLLSQIQSWCPLEVSGWQAINPMFSTATVVDPESCSVLLYTVRVTRE